MLGDGRDIVGLVSGQLCWWYMNDRWNELWSEDYLDIMRLCPRLGFAFIADNVVPVWLSLIQSTFECDWNERSR